MWLSQKAALGSREAEPDAEVGVVTAGGTRPSVMLGDEKRALEIAAPGGVFWAPAAGEQVVVTRCGDERFVSGALRAAPLLGPGEVYVSGGDSSVYLRADGSIELRGTVNVAGTLLLNGVDIRSLISLL